VAKPTKNKARSKGEVAAARDAKAEQPGILKHMEQELERGNYAGVQKLGKEAEASDLSSSDKERARALVVTVKTDPTTWTLGVGALLIALLVAASTLGG
jgi:hypothetical protein